MAASPYYGLSWMIILFLFAYPIGLVVTILWFILQVSDYEYDELEMLGNSNSDSNSSSTLTTGVILIHPIGVGIGKWFYERLMSALYENSNQTDLHLKVVVPDLLGSASACNPTVKPDKFRLRNLPLLNISDWSDQILDLMSKTQQDTNVQSWCIVANGGCSPIALQVAQKCTHCNSSTPINVSNIILSSIPRLPFFLEASSNPNKVAKSYKTLCGVIGNLFWWYSCRNEGSFIQRFSEKNLVANPQTLGPTWRSNCYKTAKMNNGRSKYSTFAFLAGALQDGCIQSLKSLKKSKCTIQVHIIKGIDKRRNRAKSWFWQSKRKVKDIEAHEEVKSNLSDYLRNNGIKGKEATVNGRISLAHEDSIGYCNSMLYFLVSKNSNTMSK